MNQTAATAATISHNLLTVTKSVDMEHYLLSHALQTSLEFHELLAIFSHEVQKSIAHSGYRYHNAAFELRIDSGIATRHVLAYNLLFEAQNLGELTFMRNQRFTAEEIKQLETLLVLLCYPLKNATLYQQALRMAHTDPLTKVSNRAAFDAVINRELQLTRRNHRPLSLIFLDIDHFKKLNDCYGHACGDAALSFIAERIKQAIRGTDLVFRFGGEEFVVLLSDTSKERARLIAERILQDINSHTLAYGLQVLDISASLGVSTLQTEDNVTSLLQRADAAMYLAKQNGRNQVRVL